MAVQDFQVGSALMGNAGACKVAREADAASGTDCVGAMRLSRIFAELAAKGGKPDQQIADLRQS